MMDGGEIVLCTFAFSIAVMIYALETGAGIDDDYYWDDKPDHERLKESSKPNRPPKAQPTCSNTSPRC